MYMPNTVQNIFFSARADSSTSSRPSSSGACFSSVPRRSLTVFMALSSNQRMDGRVQRPDQAETDRRAGKQGQQQRECVAVQGIANRGKRVHGASPSSRDWVRRRCSADAPPRGRLDRQRSRMTAVTKEPARQPHVFLPPRLQGRLVLL